MLTARRAPVRPRVTSDTNREPLPLEEEVRALLASGARGLVLLSGPPGSGKTTALKHLAAVLPTKVTLLDGPQSKEAIEAAGKGLVVYTEASLPAELHLATYRLAPWGRDEVIEYLLAVHHRRCASVMSRLTDRDQAALRGVPELWRVVLDELAADPELPDARAALHRYLEAQLPDTDLVQRARSSCLNALAGGKGEWAVIEQLAGAGFVKGLVRVLRHPEIQRLLAAERIAHDLREGGACDWLALRLPRDLVHIAAVFFGRDERIVERLGELVAGPPWGQAMAASLLLAADPRWAPAPGHVPVLHGAYLEGAVWPRAQLPGADLRGADLSDADLRGADLSHARALEARLPRARLVGALLDGVQASAADLTRADLSRAHGTAVCLSRAGLRGATLEDARLPGASFEGADLAGARGVGVYLGRANLTETNLAGADFTGADFPQASLGGVVLRLGQFRGARFWAADLRGCDLEGMELPGANFHTADLRDALFTATSMRGADLRQANLRGACLGEIDWEGAHLNGADLRGATFHMGSTRSGLLCTPIASEGTRSGFYTDDSEEQYFKAPEEIRKANLCGADLRGAQIEDVDFYLVDLRGALYDREQEQHFRRCRAILDARR